LSTRDAGGGLRTDLCETRLGLRNSSSSFSSLAMRTCAGSGFGSGTVAFCNSAKSLSNLARCTSVESGVAPLAVDYLLIVLGYCPRPNAKELGSCPVSRILAIIQGNPGFQSTWLPGQVSLVWQPLGSHCQTNIQKRTVSTKGKSPKKESHQISL
jgi:hypothetical protein